ncbi:MAG: OmpH family outer membrane protein, partial [Gaiellales bacterium]
MLLTPGVSLAEKIGVVDYQLIFDRYEATEDAQRTLDRELKEWDDEAKTMRDAIDALGDEIESQRLMLSEERLQEKQDELRRQREEYQSFAESIWGVNGRASKRNAELTQPIAERILEVVARIGDEQNLDVILDAGTGGVVWAKDDVNLTQIILDDLELAVKEQRDQDQAGESGGAAGE